MQKEKPHFQAIPNCYRGNTGMNLNRRYRARSRQRADIPGIFGVNRRHHHRRHLPRRLRCLRRSRWKNRNHATKNRRHRTRKTGSSRCYWNCRLGRYWTRRHQRFRAVACGLGRFCPSAGSKSAKQHRLPPRMPSLRLSSISLSNILLLVFRHRSRLAALTFGRPGTDRRSLIIQAKYGTFAAIKLGSPLPLTRKMRP